MATQTHVVVNELKRRIISGRYRPGERLVELQLVQELGASRTPIRLAFEELAKDGLVERLPTRGFRVKKFDQKDLSDAIDLRGVLEGMAARLAAEKGMETQRLQLLRDCLDSGRRLLEEAEAHGRDVDSRRWMTINARFHSTVVQAAGSAPLATAIETISRIPMAASDALSIPGTAPKLEYQFIVRAHHDHCDLVGAVERREGARAEYIMIEHARKTRDNKLRLLTGEIDNTQQRFF